VTDYVFDIDLYLYSNGKWLLFGVKLAVKKSYLPNFAVKPWLHYSVSMSILDSPCVLKYSFSTALRSFIYKSFIGGFNILFYNLRINIDEKTSNTSLLYCFLNKYNVYLYQMFQMNILKTIEFLPLNSTVLINFPFLFNIIIAK